MTGNLRTLADCESEFESALAANDAARLSDLSVWIRRRCWNSAKVGRTPHDMANRCDAASREILGDSYRRQPRFPGFISGGIAVREVA